AALPTVSKHVQAVMGDGVTRLVFDLAEVEFLDSMGAAYLLMTCKRARVKGGDIATATVPPIVQKTFDVLGMMEVFRNFPTVDDAVTHLKSI
ncbi:MAG: STAS domain-containing protein, partial [Planctomycetota bacterium]